MVVVMTLSGRKNNMNTYWVVETLDGQFNTIKEEQFTYRSYFQPGQYIIVNSEGYVVVRDNLMTNGDRIVYISKQDIIK